MRYYQGQSTPYVSQYVGSKYQPDLYLKAGAILEDRLNKAEEANAKFQETGEVTPGYFTGEEAKMFNEKTKQFKQQAEQAALAGKTNELRDAILKGQAHINSRQANKIKQDFDYTQKYIMPEKMKPGNIAFQGEGQDFSGMDFVPEDAYKGNRDTFQAESLGFAKQVIPDVGSAWVEKYTTIPDPVTGLLKNIQTGEQVSTTEAGRDVFGRKFAPTIDLMGSDLSNPQDFQGIPYENIKNLNTLDSKPGSAQNPDHPEWSAKQQAVYDRGLAYMEPAFHSIIKTKNTVDALGHDVKVKEASDQLLNLFTGGATPNPFETSVEIKPGQDNIESVKAFEQQANDVLKTAEVNGIVLNPQFIDALDRGGSKDNILEQLSKKDISQVTSVDLNTLNTLIPGTQNLETKLETVKQVFNQYKEQKADANFYNTIVQEGYEEAAKQGSKVIKDASGKYQFANKPTPEQVNYEYRQALIELLPNVDDPDSHIDAIPAMKANLQNQAFEKAYAKVNEGGYKIANEYIDKKLGTINEDTKAFDLNLSTDAKTESPIVQGLYKQLAVPTEEIVKQYDIKSFGGKTEIKPETLKEVKPLKVYYDGESGKLRFYGTAVQDEKAITISGDFTPAIEANPDPSLKAMVHEADLYGKIFKKVATSKSGTDNISVTPDIKVDKLGDNQIKVKVKLPDGTWDYLENGAGNLIFKNLEGALAHSAYLQKLEEEKIAQPGGAGMGKLIQVLQEP